MRSGAAVKESAARELLDATRAILPLVRASGDEAERERRLPGQVTRAMAEAASPGCWRRGRSAAWRSIRSPCSRWSRRSPGRRLGRLGAQVYSSCAHVTGFLAPGVGREISAAIRTRSCPARWRRRTAAHRRSTAAIGSAGAGRMAAAARTPTGSASPRRSTRGTGRGSTPTASLSSGSWSSRRRTRSSTTPGTSAACAAPVATTSSSTTSSSRRAGLLVDRHPAPPEPALPPPLVAAGARRPTTGRRPRRDRRPVRAGPGQDPDPLDGADPRSPADPDPVRPGRSDVPLGSRLPVGDHRAALGAGLRRRAADRQGPRPGPPGEHQRLGRRGPGRRPDVQRVRRGTASTANSPLERMFRDAQAAAQHAAASLPTFEQWGRVLIHPGPGKPAAATGPAAALRSQLVLRHPSRARIRKMRVAFIGVSHWRTRRSTTPGRAPGWDRDRRGQRR